MKMKAYLHAAISFALLLFASGAAAEEQWLQYRSARNAQKEMTAIPSRIFQLSSEKPEGLELPEFVSSEPLFFKWQSPMAAGGHILMAFDRTQPGVQYDTLYVDSNGDGKLDEEAVKAYEVSAPYGRFSPVRVVLKGEDGPVTYHLYFCVCGREKPHLHVAPACWYEGEIKIGGQAMRCVLIDYSINGTFNDKSLEAEESDRIIIGRGDAEETAMFVGNLIQIDDRFYRPAIARDGAFVDFSLADDIRFGSVVIPEGISRLSVGGENGLFDMPIKDGRVRLPVGKYSVQKYVIERKDDKGNKWKAEAGFGSKIYALDISEDAETKADIGEPFVTKLEVSERSSRYYYFNQQLAGRMGERIDIRLNGSRPGAPKLWIKNESGSYDRKHSFSYG